MKTNKILKVMCTSIIIFLLVIVSFVGVYMSQNGRMQNVVKDFKFGMDLDGGRQVILKPSDETKTVYKNEEGNTLTSVSSLSEEEAAKYTETTENINADDVLTAENYKKSRDIIKKRLSTIGLSEYQIGVDESNGNIILRAMDNEMLDEVLYAAYLTGKFVIEDAETLEVLLDNNDIKSANVGYRQLQNGTAVYLTIEMNKEGTKKLHEMSKTYISSKNDSGEEVTKNVSLYISGQLVQTTYFGGEIPNGLLQLTMGQTSTDVETITNNIKEVSNIANTLNTGPMDIEYEMIENAHFDSSISEDLVKILLIVLIVIITFMLLYTVIRYKDRGIVASATFIGYLAALLLIVRLTNIIVTVESIGAIILSIIFYYVFLNVMLRKLSKYKENDSTPKAEIHNSIEKAFYMLVPALIISVVFCFITYMAINSFGTALFWGIAIFVLYTLIVTKPLLLNFEYLFEEK